MARAVSMEYGDSNAFASAWLVSCRRSVPMELMAAAAERESVDMGTDCAMTEMTGSRAASDTQQSLGINQPFMPRVPHFLRTSNSVLHRKFVIRPLVNARLL